MTIDSEEMSFSLMCPLLWRHLSLMSDQKIRTQLKIHSETHEQECPVANLTEGSRIQTGQQ
jgi:hypothetical protein